MKTRLPASLTALFTAFLSLCLCCRTAEVGGAGQNRVGSQESKITHEDHSKIRGEGIPPNTCRIVGTVVAIDSTLDVNGRDTPCARVPCRAKVHIDSVLGYGMAFYRPLGKGEVIQATFLFTLAPTKELFPKMRPSYPGLRVGSIFKADLHAGEVPLTKKGEEVIYSIAHYELK